MDFDHIAVICIIGSMVLTGIYFATTSIKENFLGWVLNFISVTCSFGLIVGIGVTIIVEIVAAIFGVQSWNN